MPWKKASNPGKNDGKESSVAATEVLGESSDTPPAVEPVTDFHIDPPPIKQGVPSDPTLYHRRSTLHHPLFRIAVFNLFWSNSSGG